MTHAAPAARLLVALLVLAALLSNAAGAAQDGLLAQNLSFFTNQSNLLFAVLILWSIVLRARQDSLAPGPPWFDDLRGAVAFYVAMTGTIYALLVAPLEELLRWDIGWTGIVLHRLAPLVAIADWLLTRRRRDPSPRRILWWQLYPMVFLAATWLRGGLTGWYPYEFLDPTASSWGQVLVTTAVVLVAFFAIAAAVHLLEGRLHRRKVPQVTAEPAVR